MPAQLTTDQVWTELGNQMFAVIGMVTARNESRTAGIVYTVENRKLYFSTETKAWKTRHLQNNPSISVTVTIAKRIPFVPWVKIPPATITFSGTARTLGIGDVSDGITHALLHGLESSEDLAKTCCFIEIVPSGDFLTYGVGVSLAAMRDTDAARGRAPVG